MNSAENSSDKTVALVAGGSGLIGRQLLNQLAENDHYDGIKALLRKPLPTADKSDRIEEIVGDFEDMAQLLAGTCPTDIYCCLGTTIKTAGSKAAFEQVDLHYVEQLAQLGKQAGATNFIVISAIGANAQSPFFYNQVKGQMEEAVCSIGYAACHVIRPSILVGDRQESRPGEAFGIIAGKLVAPLLLGSLKKYRPDQDRDVAALMIRCATSGKTGNHIHHLE